MSDFFGVSSTCLLLRLLVKLLVVDVNKDLAVDEGVGLAILDLRLAVMKGCRRAACGFSRRSGSHTRHFEMKSRKSSSSQRRT